MADDKSIQQLRESEEKYRKMIEMANDAIFTIDTLCGTIIDTNPKASDLTGRTREELLKLKLWEIHPLEEQDKAKALFREVKDSGKGKISRLHCMNNSGRLVPVEVSSSKFSYGNKTVIQRICRDISDRVNIEEREQRMMDIFRDIFDIMPVGIGVRTNLSTSPQVMFENKKLKEMFNIDNDRPAADWCECPMEAMADPNSREFLGGSGLYGIERQLPDGRVFLFTAHYFRGEGNEWFELRVVQDISVHHQLEDELRKSNEQLEFRVEARTTELHEKQSQLVQAEKMASLGNLVAGVAHEINTPLGALKSNNDLFIRSIKKLKGELDGCGDTALSNGNMTVSSLFESIENLNSINETAAKRIVGIVNSLRNFARLDQAEKDRVDIHVGLDNTLTLVNHRLKNRVEIIKEYGNLPKVNCFPNQLNQVFMNILVNASQAIEGKGTIHIKTRIEGPNVVVSFQDSGSGIPGDLQRKIFDPGYTTKGAGVGTGLGLSIVHQIIEAHQGRIEVESAAGEGTTFTFLIPID